MSYISHIELDDKHSPPPTDEIEKERRVALYDLLEGNKSVSYTHLTLPTIYSV